MVQLVTIAPGHQLDAPAAAAFQRAVAAGCPVTITSSYRPPAKQASMRAQYEVDLAAYRAGRGPKPTFVAQVADSEHVIGNALDLKPPAEAWMRAHPQYGFVFTDPTERWHVAYRATRDQHLTDRTDQQLAAPAVRELVPEQESVMIYRAQGTRDFIFDGWTYLQGADGVLRPLSAKEFQARTWADPDLKVAEWSADDLHDLALRCGIYAFAGTAADRDPLGLLGTIIGRNATATIKGGHWS